jgi:uncharacterized membrane protein YcgQ (UPF0703/DUF1980 family)
MRVFKRFKTVTICSAVVAMTCFFIGIVISYLYATPAGASVVMMNIITFLIFWGISGILQKTGRTAKKAVLASVAAVLLIAGCSNYKIKTTAFSAPVAESAEEAELPVPEGVDLVIREKLFIAQINDVLLNRDDYMGKMIKLEGIFLSGEAGGREYCYVIRKGPGCCGDDGQVGFEVSWDPPDKAVIGENLYPKRNDWVEAQGVLSKYEEYGSSFLYLALAELNVLEKRGKEFVAW